LCSNKVFATRSKGGKHFGKHLVRQSQAQIQILPGAGDPSYHALDQDGNPGPPESNALATKIPLPTLSRTSELPKPS
jgi:hypothetical protein